MESKGKGGLVPEGLEMHVSRGGQGPWFLSSRERYLQRLKLTSKYSIKSQRKVHSPSVE